MSPLRIVLVDDNEDSLEILEYYIQQSPSFEIIAKCMDGDQFIETALIEKPDLVLIDINMPKLNGVEAIKTCLEFIPDLNFIFVTSYDEYAVQAFELSAIDYVVKPIEKTRLYKALDKAIAKIQNSSIVYQGPESNRKSHRLMVKFNSTIYYIPQDDIIFIEKQGKKCILYTVSGTFETYENISSIQNELSNTHFFMSHRSYIVNLNKVSHITSKNETYLIYFLYSDKYAHLSKLKFDEFQEKIAIVMNK